MQFINSYIYVFIHLSVSFLFLFFCLFISTLSFLFLLNQGLIWHPLFRHGHALFPPKWRGYQWSPGAKPRSVTPDWKFPLRLRKVLLHVSVAGDPNCLKIVTYSLLEREQTSFRFEAFSHHDTVHYVVRKWNRGFACRREGHIGVWGNYIASDILNFA